MKYPQNLHLDLPIPLKGSLLSAKYYFDFLLNKLVKVSRDPNHPRSGIYYRICATPKYGNHVELVLKRVYPQPKKNGKNN